MDILNPGSFRDPDGFMFSRGGQLFRQINHSCKEDYDLLMKSGLYEELVSHQLLIPHQDIDPSDIPFSDPAKGYKIIQPEFIPFISYPYEWSFSQLKDAALATLAIQKRAFEKGMTLKDSSAYNIQFVDGKPVLIDTLSFEKYKDGEPWIAYRQFCQHFLAPLALMALRDIRLGQLLRVYIDGIPLDLAASLLPTSARFNMSVYMHIILHGKSQKRHEGDRVLKKDGRKMSKLGFMGIISSLETAVSKLKWIPEGTEWDDYYNDTNYTPAAIEHKKQIVLNYIETATPNTVWDLGANNGLFSRIASEKGIPTLAFDIDPSAVEKNYLHMKTKKEAHMLPLLMDLTNPSSGIGWENNERTSFMKRGPVDLVLSLALIHHLAISNNVPLAKIAAFFGQLCQYLIMEFVPKNDSQVQRLLVSREDVFPHYTKEDFEKEFSIYFDIRESTLVKDSLRTLYLLERKNLKIKE
ncbi:MAG: SAM-dependent methyltransferase [Candidatus Omnitrophota bacterium]